jgi:hypothetical protein
MRICLVLGAGASLANAQKFHPEKMRETWPPLDTTFFETASRRGMSVSAALRRYFEQVVGIDPTPMTLRELRMEEVFKDAFYDLDENPKDKVVLNGYIDLVDLYLRLLRDTTNWLGDDKRKGAPIGRLLAAAAKQAEDLTVITFNHDLVIENEIYKRAQLRNRWCLDEGYGSIGPTMAHAIPVNAAVPVFPIHSDGHCDHARPITILKLHGSLNWIVRLTSDRPTANFLRGQGGKKPISLMTRRGVSLRGGWVRSGSGRGRSRWDTWPVVVPPIYAKQALRSAVVTTWSDARAALLAADRIVFFGYSLPGIDIEAEKLIERALAKSPTEWVDVVNPAAASAARFAEVSKTVPVRWYPSLDDFFQGGAFA